MGNRIELPAEDVVPPGPYRRLLVELHRLYKAAGRPALRTLSAEIRADNDLPVTLSHEAIRQILRGVGGIPRWPTLKSLAWVLARHAQPRGSPDAEVQRFLHLWEAAGGISSISAAAPHERRYKPPTFHAIETAVATVLPPEAQPGLKRDPIVAHLSALLDENQVLALTGMSGTGKSQVALNYLKTHSSNYIFCGWIRASRLDGVFADLASLAPSLGVVSLESLPIRDVATAVKQKLEETPGWLLVVDDAAGAAVLDVLPSSGGHLLITSKSPAWPCFRYEIERLSVEEVASLLDRVAITSNQKLVGELVRVTAGHALAIVQAVSYIIETGMGLAGYIGLAKEHRLELLRRGERVAELSVHAAIQDSVDRLSPRALNILKVLSVMSSDPVVIEAMVDAKDPLLDYLPASRLLLEDCIAEIRSLSLLQREESKVAVHELVREVVAGMMSPLETMYALLGATHIITQQLPVRTESPDNWPIVELLLPHLLEVTDGYRDLPGSPPSAMAFFLNRIAPYFQSRGDEVQAESLLNQGLEALEGSTADEDLGMKAAILTNLATIVADRGDLERAQEMHQAALEIKTALPEPPWLSIAVSYGSLGLLAERKGELHVALGFYKQALLLHRELNESARTADCLVDLARLKLNLGELADAKMFACQAVEEAGRSQDGWPDLANAYETLARIGLKAGDCNAALQYSAESVRICEAPAVDSTNLARALALRGLVLNNCGTPDEACEVLERSVRIFGAFRHSADLDVARAEGNLGAALTHAGRPLEARPHLWKSYRDLQKLVEDPHPSLTTARVLLIQCASASGDEAEIQSILESITSKEAAADLLNTIGPPIGIIIDPDQADENTDRPDKS